MLLNPNLITQTMSVKTWKDELESFWGKLACVAKNTPSWFKPIKWQWGKLLWNQSTSCASFHGIKHLCNYIDWYLFPHLIIQVPTLKECFQKSQKDQLHPYWHHSLSISWLSLSGFAWSCSGVLFLTLEQFPTSLSILLMSLIPSFHYLALTKSFNCHLWLIIAVFN